MAVVGPRYEDAKTKFCDFSIGAVLDTGEHEVAELFVPIDGQPLHFNIDNHPDYCLMPYLDVPEQQTFTCFPVVV